MLPKNVIMMQEFERQSRARLQQEAENTRMAQPINHKPAAKNDSPAWNFTWTKFRLILMRLNPAG